MIKFSGHLFSVQAGQTITIVGRSNSNAQRIDIELLSGNSHGIDSGDIQFHMSARFLANDTSIVRNTHVRGVGWQKEERRENLIPFNTALNPIKKGGDFKVVLFIDQSAFLMSIDDKPFCTYAHRLPIVGIQQIKITRDVDEIYQVNQRSAQPNLWPALKTNTFQSFAPRQFNPGNVIVITGMPQGNPNGDFTINFYDGSNKQRIHFHIRVYPSRKNLILNSQLENGNWREQIVVKPSPFYPFAVQQTFKLAIGISNIGFLLAVNGLRIAEMPYRENIKSILNAMTGFELIRNNGMNVVVTAVDHMITDANCGNFEKFSNILK